jgi:predicted PurR-regulated permease PerM
VSTSALIPRPVPEPVAERAYRLVRGLGLLALAALVVWKLSFLVVPLLGAWLIVYLLQPIVDLLQDRGVRRRTAVGFCAVLLALVLAGSLAATLPWLARWLEEVPSAGERSVFEVQLEARLGEWEQWGRARYPNLNWTTLAGQARHVLEAERRGLMEKLPLMAVAFVSRLGLYALAPVIGIFLLLDGPRLYRSAMSWVPNRYFEIVLLLVYRVDRKIAGYLRGIAAQAAILTVVMALALTAVRMPAAPVFALIFAVLNVIPILGPLLGASAGLLYAMVEPQAPSLILLVAIYSVVHAVDAAILQPLVVGRSLDLHPVAIVIALAVGGTLGGMLGMLVSVPLLAIAKAVAVTLVEARRQGRLG